MEIINDFRNYLLKKNISNPTTLKNYLSDVRHFTNWYEKSFGIPFEPRELEEGLIKLYEGTSGASILAGGIVNQVEKISHASVKRRLSSLRQFARFAVENKYIEKNPFELITNHQSPITSLDIWHIAEFRDYLKFKKASELTVKNYVTDIHSFRRWYESAIEPHVGNTSFPVINDSIISEYKTRLVEHKLSAPRTVNRKLSSIRKYVEFAILANYTNKDFFYTPTGVENLEISKEQAQISATLSLNDIEEQKLKFNYSPIPPIRLIQRLLIVPYILAESAIAQKIITLFYGSKVLGLASKKINSSLPRIKVPQKVSDLLKIKGYEKSFYAPNEISLDYYPFHKKLWHHIRFTRPNWYKKYHSLPVVHYIHFAILIVFCAGVGIALYRNLVTDQTPLFAAPVSPPRILSFQGRLTDNLDNPITTATDLRFAIYDDLSASGAALLWQEVHYDTNLDQDGIFSVLLGTNTPIPDSVFFENNTIYLGVTIEQTAELAPRRRIASVPYAANSESLQGMLPITDGGAGTTNVVLALDSAGDLTIGGTATPTFAATGGQFTLSGTVLLLTTNTGTSSNVIISPDGIGKIDVQKPLINTTTTGNLVPGGVEVNDKFGVLATESAVAAFIVNNNTAGGDIFTASSSGTPRFTVENDGILRIPVYATAGGIFYTNGTGGLVAQTTAGSGGQCLQSAGGGTPTWGTCGSGSLWRISQGTISPINDTLDLLIGSNASSSAKFAILNVNSGNPTASLSGNLSLVSPTGANPATLFNILNGGSLNIGTSIGGDTGLTSRLFVANNGNVGIGNASPTEKVTIQNNLVGNHLGIYDGANNNNLLLADAGVLTLKPTGFDTIYTFDGTSTYTNNTTESKTNGGTAYTILSVENPSNDIFYVGLDHPFSIVNFDIAQAGGGVTLVREYFNGSWTSLTSTDNTSNLTVDGTVTFTAPSDWTTTSVNGTTKYWVRFSSSTQVTTAPTALFTTPTTGHRFYAYAQSGDANPAFYISDKGRLGIRTTSPLAGFDIRGIDGTTTVASISGNTNQPALLIDNAVGAGDQLVASKSGQTIFRVDNDGNLIVGKDGGGKITAAIIDPYLVQNQYTTGNTQLTFQTMAASNGDFVYKNQSTTLATLAQAGQLQLAINGSAGGLQIGDDTQLFRGDTNRLDLASGDSLNLVSGNLAFGGTTVIDSSRNGFFENITVNGGCTGCTTPSDSPFKILAGAIVPHITTTDFLIGGQATASAKFAVLNIDSGTPTASVSATAVTDRPGLYMTGTGTLSSVNMGTLTIGGSTTGNIVIEAGGSGVINLLDNTNVTGNFDTSGTLTAGTGDAFTVSATGEITTVTSNTINGLSINTGAISGVTGFTQSTGAFAFSGAGNFSVDSAGFDVTTGGAISGVTTLSLSGAISDIDSAVTINDDLDVTGNTGITLTGAGAGLTFSGTGNHLIQASTGVLQIGATTLTGAITGNSQSITGLNNLSAAGTITFSGFAGANDGGVIYANSSGVLSQTGAGTGSQCLLGGTTPTFGSCGTGTTLSPFQELTTGAIVPNNSTVDFLIGGQATTSAKFAVLNINLGTPVASISAISPTTALSLSSNGSIQTVRNNTLTIGGDTTGNIVISPLNGGTGSTLTVNAITANLTGTTTLNATSLGTINSATTLGISGTTLNLGNGSAASLATTSNQNLTVSAGSGILNLNTVDNGAVTTGTGLTTLGGNLTINGATTTFANAAPVITTGTDTNLTITPNGSGNLILTSDFNTGVKIGASSNPLAPLSVIGGIGSNASFIVDQLNSGNIIAASSSGTTRLTIDNAGNLQLFGQADLRFADADSSNYVAFQAPATVGTNVTWTLPDADSSGCFQSNGSGTLSISTCGSGGDSFWTQNLGLLYPGNTSMDLGIGGTSTASAKFVFKNVLVGDPTLIIRNSGATESLNLSHDGSVGIITSSTDTINIGSGGGSLFLETDIVNDTVGFGGAVKVADKLLVQHTETAGTALSVFDNLGAGDIFTASNSGTPRFSITSAGGIKLGTSEGTGGECLKSGGAGLAASWGACASQTPWTSDIDADGFDLFDLSNLLFRETTGAPTGADVGLFRDNAGDLNLNVLTGKTFNVQVNGTDEYNFSSTALAMNGNNITGVGTNITAAAGLAIATTTTGILDLDTGTTGAINIGTGANAKALTFGNTGVATTFGFNTGVNTTTGMTLTANSLSSGTGLLLTSSGTITSGGEVLSVVGNGATTGRLIDLSSTGLTSGQAINLAMGTALTTGSGLAISGAVYDGTTTTESSLASLSFSGARDNTSGNSIVNGLNISSTLNTTGATGTKQLNALNIASPALTGCTGGACTWNGNLITTATSGFLSTITQNALNIAATGISNGTLRGINIGNITGGAGTENAIVIGTGWDNQIVGNGWSVDGTGTLTVASCTGCSDGSGGAFDVLSTGVTVQKNQSTDLLIGASATSSAKFAVLNVDSGTPTASVSATAVTDRPGLYMTGTGILSSVNKGTLTIGSADTGNIVIGTDATARTVTIGNSTTTTALNLNTGTGGLTIATAGTERFVVDSNGRLQIGTSTAPANLDLNPFVRIYNSASHTDPAASISAKTTSASLVVTNDGSGNVITASASGKTVFELRNNGDVVIYGDILSPGADFAEYFLKENPSETFEAGMLVCQSENSGVTKCNSNNPNHKLLGAISDSPLITGGGDKKNDSNYVLVGLVGQLKVRVAGDIEVGDPLTISPTTGIAVKATSEATVIGYAMESNNNGAKPRVASSIQKSYYNPNLALNYSGDDPETFLSSLSINEVNGKWHLTDAFGNVVNRTSAFSNLVAANIKAGFVNAQKIAINTLTASTASISNLTAGVINGTSATIANISTTSLNASSAVLGSVSIGSENVLVAGVSLRDYIASVVTEIINNQALIFNGDEIVSPIASIDEINTNIISPLAGEDIEIDGRVVIASKAKQSQIATDSANPRDDILLEVEGSASISGNLASDTLKTNDATISGTLSADRIIANTIDGLDDRISSVASSLIASNQLNTSSPSAISYQLSANSDLEVGNLYADFGIYSQGLSVLGSITTSQLTAMDSIAIGTGFIMTDNSINTLGATLEIQPLRQGDISFMAGRVKIDTDGNVDINGNLNLAGIINATDGVFGGIRTNSLATNIISPLPDSDLVIKLGNNSGASTSGSLKIANANGDEVLKISGEGNIVASGSATFDKLNFNLVGEALADSDLTATATGSAGFATVQRNKPEVTIYNDKITKDSLIYITPFGDTQNKVLHLLRQVPQSETADGSFTVGISGTPATIDIQFNWLIVN